MFHAGSGLVPAMPEGLSIHYKTNGRLAFGRRVIVDRMNAILARHYWATLADDSHRN